MRRCFSSSVPSFETVCFTPSLIRPAQVQQAVATLTDSLNNQATSTAIVKASRTLASLPTFLVPCIPTVNRAKVATNDAQRTDAFGEQSRLLLLPSPLGTPLTFLASCAEEYYAMMDAQSQRLGNLAEPRQAHEDGRLVLEGLTGTLALSRVWASGAHALLIDSMPVSRATWPALQRAVAAKKAEAALSVLHATSTLPVTSGGAEPLVAKYRLLMRSHFAAWPGFLTLPDVVLPGNLMPAFTDTAALAEFLAQNPEHATARRVTATGADIVAGALRRKGSVHGVSFNNGTPLRTDLSVATMQRAT